MAIPKNLRLGEPYHIQWTDAASYGGGWHDSGSSLGKLITAETLGYLVKATKTYVVVAQSKNEVGQISDTMAIPRSMVRRMKRLAL